MKLSIDARLAYHFPEACEVLLLIEAADGPDQTVLSQTLTFSPECEVTRMDDAATGERRAVFRAEGRVDIRYTAEVEVQPRDDGLAGLPAPAIGDLPAEALDFLRASLYCPSDRFEAFVAAEFSELSGGDQVLAMLDWIGSHLTYTPGVSDASTTALDTFVDRAGVCRDYAHLAMSLCRAAQIPARAMSGYAWQLDPPDMHAVVEVYLDGAWRRIDPTGLAPTEGLVRVATGRDAADIAFMSIFGRADLVQQSFTVERLDAG